MGVLYAANQLQIQFNVLQETDPEDATQLKAEFIIECLIHR